MKISRLLLIAAAAALVAGPAGAADQAPATPSAPDTALMIIDIQNFYFAGGPLPLVHPVEASLQAKRLLEAFRTAGLPVIHVQHLPKDRDTPDPTGIDEPYRIHANVLPKPGEVVIGKHYANAFRDTDLLATLRRLGVKHLVICGMQTHMCIEAATRAAADLGFDVTVVHDACATRDLEFGGVTVPAAQVHAAALAAMQGGGYAKVVSTDEELAALK